MSSEYYSDESDNESYDGHKKGQQTDVHEKGLTKYSIDDPKIMFAETPPVRESGIALHLQDYESDSEATDSEPPSSGLSASILSNVAAVTKEYEITQENGQPQMKEKIVRKERKGLYKKILLRK